MERIESFNVNHDKLLPGIYISRQDDDIVTYDLRFKRPNGGEYLENAAMHTIEHLMATFLRNNEHRQNIIYFGPMGCRTGFYLLVRNMSGRQVVSAVKESFDFIANFDGLIPGVSSIECGNYLEHDLKGARRECIIMSKVIENHTESQLKYIK